MGSNQHPREEDLEDILQSNPDRFLEVVYQHFRARLFRRIKRFGRGFLDTEDCWDVFQVVMFEVHKKIRKPDFDPRRPLRFVNEVAARRAIDARRRRCGKKVNSATMDEWILRDVADTRIATAWKQLGQDEWRRFEDTLLEIIESLPERQRMAAQAKVDHFEKIQAEGIRALAEAIEQTTGEHTTDEAARSAWFRARRKIQDELVKRDFGFLKGPEDDG